MAIGLDDIFARTDTEKQIVKTCLRIERNSKNKEDLVHRSIQGAIDILTKPVSETIKEESLRDIVLAGDIGATNSGLGLYGKNEKNGIVTLYEGRYRSKELYKGEAQKGDFAPVIDHFLKKAGIATGQIEKAVLAAAGPLIEGKVQMTKANFYVDPSTTGVDDTQLLNDFEAIAGVLKMHYENNAVLEMTMLEHSTGEYADDISKRKKGDVGVIGAGSGLGVSTLIYDEATRTYKVKASEGGHSTLAIDVSDEEDIKIAKWLMRYERGEEEKPGTFNPRDESALCGDGIVHVLEYFIEKGSPGVNRKQVKLYKNEINKFKEAEDQAAYIAKMAKQHPDSIFANTMNYFYKHLGMAVRNLFIHELAEGGVVIAGGILPKNLFDGKIVPRNFNKNVQRRIMEAVDNSAATHNPLIRKAPIYVLTDEKAGLKGAMYKAFGEY
ncbi:glucokinase [Candidatus Woesearchaeota archaeon]|nr:glucokinase [Candidatus Woesearchaeota archaeon]